MSAQKIPSDDPCPECQARRFIISPSRPPRPLSPEERSLKKAVDTKDRALIDGETVTAGVSARLWGAALAWREWVEKEGRS